MMAQQLQQSAVVVAAAAGTPQAGSQTLTKTSPRKFSEKIALLNKKEAEGTAEFEEIIKEVQATRSNHNQPAVIAGSESLDDQIRIEQVYEDLVKCVGQIEEELRESGQYNSEQIQPASRSASAGSGHYQPAEPSFATTNNFSGIQQQQQGAFSYQQQRRQTHSIRSTDDNNFPAGHARQAQPETGLRARVTSFGSANQKYAAASYCQQPLACSRYNPYPSEHARSVSCRSKPEMYLAPSDKAWQKSCSDPTLHVPCAPIASAISCSDNLLSAEEIKQQQQQTLTFQQHQNGGMPGEGGRKLTGYEAYEQLAEVPNIQICNIDDETHHQPALPAASRAGDPAGLPDLTSLQFSSSPPQQLAACSQRLPYQPLPAREQLCNSLSSSQVAGVPNGRLWQLAGCNGKVSNLLSASDCGLNPSQPTSGELAGSVYSSNIMRSHSHNSIDHLRKGVIDQPNGYQLNNPPAPVLSSYQYNRFAQDYPNSEAFQAQTQPLRAKFNGGGCGQTTYNNNDYLQGENVREFLMDESSSSSSCPTDQAYRMFGGNFNQQAAVVLQPVPPEVACPEVYAGGLGYAASRQQMFNEQYQPDG